MDMDNDHAIVDNVDLFAVDTSVVADECGQCRETAVVAVPVVAAVAVVDDAAVHDLAELDAPIVDSIHPYWKINILL
jgi:hypothetical protein